MKKSALQKYRNQTQKTQAKCAEELGITVVYYSDLERGKHKPSPRLAMKIERWSNEMVSRGDLRPDLWVNDK